MPRFSFRLHPLVTQLGYDPIWVYCFPSYLVAIVVLMASPYWTVPVLSDLVQ